jgi:diadenosine tetraphosphate (Ap4A) HIT family hydrolase
LIQRPSSTSEDPATAIKRRPYVAGERGGMTLPYAEPLTLREPADLTLPEPPRRGEEGGEPCFPCSPESRANAIWADERWSLHNPGQTSLAGSVWLTSREHFDSYADMPAQYASTLAGVVGRAERAVLALGEVGRVHVYRWGEGGSHFHLWLVPRPVGRMDMAGPFLPVWEDTMPPLGKAEIEAVGEKIAAAMDA